MAAERAGRGGWSAVAPAGDVAAFHCVSGQSAITGTTPAIIIVMNFDTMFIFLF